MSTSMNNFANTTKIGTKGSDVYTAEGVGDPRVVLNTILVRGATAEDIQPHLYTLYEMAKTDRQAFEDMWVLLFQNRDVRGGKGERATSELIWDFMIQHDNRDVVSYMLDLVPTYGCWRDLFVLAETRPLTMNDPVVAKIVRMSVDQITKDASAVSANQREMALNPEGERVPVSLLAKWIPRENRMPQLAKMIAKELFPEVNRPSTLMQRYRKMISGVNAYIQTTETYMCSKNYDQINPSRVPGRCLQKNMRAFLNENKDGSLRHPDDEKRNECREHFQEYFQQAKEGKVTVKAKGVVYPHEIIRKVATSGDSLSVDERNGIIAQWDALVKAAKETGGLGRSLVMCDFSGSMQSSATNRDTPYWVSMAMGLLISEITTDEFKNTILTFDSSPSIFRLPEGDVFTKVAAIVNSHISQGTSTDFQKAMDVVLANMKRNRVRPGNEPDNLIVVTDMNWDAACGSNQISYYTGNSYRHNNKTASWQTHIQMIRENFRRAGEDMWGTPFTPPRIVIWNVAAGAEDFHATKDEEGVVMICGWSPSLFKDLMKGEIRKMTPYEMVRLILDDDRYNLVRETLAPHISGCYVEEEAKPFVWST